MTRSTESRNAQRSPVLPRSCGVGISHGERCIRSGSLMMFDLVLTEAEAVFVRDALAEEVCRLRRGRKVAALSGRGEGILRIGEALLEDVKAKLAGPCRR